MGLRRPRLKEGGIVRVRPFRGYNSAQATLWLSARSLINSPPPTFSIFLAFILCTPCILIFSLVSTLVYLVHHLVYLVLSILLNSTLFAYILPSVFRPRPSLSNSKSSAFAPLAPLPHNSSRTRLSTTKRHTAR